jgi:hypothetical protein
VAAGRFGLHAEASTRREAAGPTARKRCRSREASPQARVQASYLRREASRPWPRLRRSPHRRRRVTNHVPLAAAKGEVSLRKGPLQESAGDAQSTCPKYYCHSVAPSSGSVFTGAELWLSNGSVPAEPHLVHQLKTISDRFKHALTEEKRSQNSVESQVGFAVNRYATGKRGGSTVDVDKMKALADVLHVRVEWLVWGDGPMRRGGRDTTPAEEAMFLARQSGTPEHVLQSALERFRDKEGTMTALDWAVAFYSEEQVWRRASAQRVETMDAPLPQATVDKLLPPAPKHRKSATFVKR